MTELLVYWEIANGVPVLSTLFLLSYSKLFNTIITALSYTTLHTAQGQVLVWSADGNLDYLGSEHVPVFAVALAVPLFLWLPYTLLLLLGQWLHRFNCRIITRMLLKLKPFLDAHYAAFKDKHRYWFGVLLLARAAILLTSAIVPANVNASSRKGNRGTLCRFTFEFFLASMGLLNLEMIGCL